MKKKVSFFVAGSKQLSHERNALKALAQEMNTRYNERGVDVFIETKSYEDFKDTQEEYNKYISDTADMAMFVLEGSIGSITRKEFKVAADSFNRKASPEILVFLHNYDVETDGIRDILDLLKDRLGDDFYYISYDDVADLKFKAERRITQFISPTDFVRGMRKWRMIAVTTIIAVLACGLLYLASNLLVEANKKHKVCHWSEEQPILLFLGGGSVAKCLQMKLHIKIDDISNMIYMGVPTGNLWNMLGEEFFKNEDIDNQSFYPVFLAANSIDIETTEKAIPVNRKLSERIQIFELFISNDTIKTYISNGWKRNHSEYDFNNLDSATLTNIIATAYKDEVLYTTSPESGTLKAYSDSVLRGGLIDVGLPINKVTLKELVSNEKSRHKVYNERTPIEGDFVLLGSDYYFPFVMGEHKKFEVKKISKKGPEPIYKKLYVYFVGYKDTRKESQTCGKYRIPGRVMSFLNQVHIKEKDLWDWKEGDDYAIFKNSGDIQCDTNGIVRLSIEEKALHKEK